MRKHTIFVLFQTAMFLSYVALFCLVVFPLHVQCACELGSLHCRLADGSTGFCMDGVCYRVSAGVRNNLRVTIKVKYPEATLQVNRHVATYRFIQKLLKLQTESRILNPHYRLVCRFGTSRFGL